MAVTSGFAGAHKLMEQIKAGESPYHFIEIMGCPGGCITGGGQPRSDDPDIRAKRLSALYTEDESKVLRKSHENPAIQKIYADFLGHPNGHLSHKLLHTHYTQRGLYNQMTDEVFVVDYKQSPETKPAYAPAGTGDINRARSNTQKARAEALRPKTRCFGRLPIEQDTVNVFQAHHSGSQPPTAVNANHPGIHSIGVPETVFRAPACPKSPICGVSYGMARGITYND